MWTWQKWSSSRKGNGDWRVKRQICSYVRAPDIMVCRTVFVRFSTNSIQCCHCFLPYQYKKLVGHRVRLQPDPINYLEGQCGRYLLRWSPMIPTSYYSCPGIIPSPWVRNGPSNLLLMNRIWQKWWEVFSEARFQKIAISTLLTFSWPLTGLLCRSQLSCCKLPYREVPRARNIRGLRPIAREELRPPNNHMSELGRGSFPSWGLRWQQPLLKPWWKPPGDPEPSKLHPDLWTPETIR